ncbi:8008_t:CDS:2 [Entrophospora sp. SA101]|nr:8008_t:CDS:2 [Entrophospora sp. SA101]CAJ0858038.1 11358_t:CDS:2 [Entrophospora sp. SA101]
MYIDNNNTFEGSHQQSRCHHLTLTRQTCHPLSPEFVTRKTTMIPLFPCNPKKVTSLEPNKGAFGEDNGFP